MKIMDKIPNIQIKVEAKSFKFIKRSSFNMSPLEKVCFEKVFNYKIGINGESIQINDKK